MMRKVLFFILILILQSLTSFAQDCYNSIGTTDKNCLEINFSDVEVKSEGGNSYLYFTLNVKRLGTWYNKDGIELAMFNNYLTSFDVWFDFNTDVMKGDLNTAAIECLEWGKFSFMGMMTYPWDQGYCGDYWSNITQPQASIIAAKFSFMFDASKGAQTMAYELPTDTYALLGKFRWPIKSGITTGQTGVAVRLNEDIYNDKFLYTTEAYNSGNGPMNFCISGQPLDIPISDTPVEKPVLAEVTGPTAICQGVEGSYTTSFAAGADGATVNGL